MEDFVCKHSVKLIVDWLKGGETDKHCPPCLIKPLAEMYLGTLEQGGASDQVKSLNKAWESGDALTIAGTMDKIKSEVGDSLRKELVTFDCMAQSHEDQ